MKKLIIISVITLLATSIQSQEVINDSVFYKGRYYYSDDPNYEQIKDDLSKLNFETWFMPGPGIYILQPESYGLNRDI